MQVGNSTWQNEPKNFVPLVYNAVIEHKEQAAVHASYEWTRKSDGAACKLAILNQVEFQVPEDVTAQLGGVIETANKYDSSKDESHKSSDGVHAAKIQMGSHSSGQGGNNNSSDLDLRTQHILIYDGKAATKERLTDAFFMANKDKSNVERLFEPGHRRAGGRDLMQDHPCVIGSEPTPLPIPEPWCVNR